MGDLFQDNYESLYNITADTLNIPGNVNISELKIGNLDVSGSFSGNINIANMYTVNTTDNLTIKNQLKVGDLDYINPYFSNSFKTNIENTINKYAWDPAINQEVPHYWTDILGETHPYHTKLPFTKKSGEIDTNMLPAAVCQINKNNEVISFYKGKVKPGVGINAPPDENTYFNWYSMSKVLPSLLYARLITLGVFESGTQILVEDYLPILKEIEFLVPRYEDSSIPLSDDGINVKDASGNPYRVPYEDPQPDIYTPTPIAKLGIAGKYVNVYKSTRKLFLHDCLNDCVGFVSGYTDFLLGLSGSVQFIGNGQNENHNYGWTAAVKDTSNFSDASGLWKSEVFSLAQIVSGEPFNENTLYGGGLCYNPTLEILLGGVNHVTNNILLTPTKIHLTPEEHIKEFFEKFRGKTYMQLFDHGTFNYNSGETWSTAVLTKAYNDKFNTTYSYYEILKKEILDPIGADNATYYFNGLSDPRLNNIATIWEINTDPNYPFYDSSSYIVSQYNTSMNTDTGLSLFVWNLALGLFYNGALPPYVTLEVLETLKKKPIIWQKFLNGTGTNKAKLYLQSNGFYSTIGDFNKILRLIANHGLFYDKDGNMKRLIHATHIQQTLVPAINLLTKENQQNSIFKIYGNEFAQENTYSHGKGMIGPTYSNNINVEDFNTGEINGIFKGLIPKCRLRFPESPIDGCSWNGAGGTHFSVYPSKKTSFVLVGLEGLGTITPLFWSDIYDSLYNELMVPDSDNSEIFIGRLG
jgi:CubicO group peptidase (beta-lactamase class C family)